MRFFFASILLVVSVFSSPAFATEPGSAESVNWSVGAGAGLGLGSVGLSPYSVATETVTPAPALRSSLAPALNLFVERRLGQGTWLLLHAHAGYSAARDELKTDLKSELALVDTTLGTRVVLNPGGVVEVSGFAAAAFTWAKLLQRGEQSRYDVQTGAYATHVVEDRSEQWSVGVQAGLAFEYLLMSQLALRFSSSVVGAEYFSIRSSIERRSHGGSVGLRFRPALELRYSF